MDSDEGAANVMDQSLPFEDAISLDECKELTVGTAMGTMPAVGTEATTIASVTSVQRSHWIFQFQPMLNL